MCSMNPANAIPMKELLTEEKMEAIAAKTTAMASDGDEIREAAAVGRTLLERYGDEAQLVKKVGTGIDTEFIKKNRGRTWTPFIEWCELAEDADLPEAEQTYRWLPVVSPGHVQTNPGTAASDNNSTLPPPPPSRTPPASPKAGCGQRNTNRQIASGSQKLCKQKHGVAHTHDEPVAGEDDELISAGRGGATGPNSAKSRTSAKSRYYYYYYY